MIKAVSRSLSLDSLVNSNPCKVTQSGVIAFEVSDHNLIICTREFSDNATQVRSMKNYNAQVFREKPKTQNWYVIDSDNVYDARDPFKVKF